MKGIGVFVLLLLAGFGVAMYFVTRPPNRHLDSQGRAWVDRFTVWRDAAETRTDRVVVAIGTAPNETSARLVSRLGPCTEPLTRLGPPPSLLEVVVKDASAACGEIERAMSVNARFGVPALATTRLHLHRAEEWLAQARIDLRESLHPKSG